MSGPGRYDTMIIGAQNISLKKGDTICIDGGPRYKGYFCDIQRNICIGEPPEKIKRLHNISVEATQTAIDFVRPGIKASDVYEACDEVLRKYGLKMIIEFAGHMGLYTHEPPYFVPDDDTELKSGMYLAIEVAAIERPAVPGPEPDCVMMWPEDNVLVTKNGYGNLTEKLSKDLWIVE